MEKTPSPINVIIFGQTGAGKSSVVNMICGPGSAFVSSSAEGVTTQSAYYVKDMDRKRFHIYDTPGLNEGPLGKVSAKDAILGLHTLFCQLANGVSLLVFVMKGPRITDFSVQNYRLLYEQICDRKVPIVIAVTGMELEPDMKEWWRNNKEAFDKHRMSFHGHACITAVDTEIYKGLYRSSQEQVARLIVEHFTSFPWKRPEVSRFAAAISWALRMLGIRTSDFNSDSYEMLKKYYGLSGKEAKNLARQLK